ncbi:molybdopterin-dependent oxidoreductase [Nocardioides sp. TF02-7]|uniref:molybdopterin-dependent oxidoreductase n=1 Tax=Nocardioides sp. TF02-7 TaxID=2917724 RepID=UPI001F0680D5|nr:molybdopterin-dependent oxidoreductase [Nocardioides sp. TF02-7]UMG91327.1 molybdopterin-dependent oxidoreductase [Nocardioides sp. TF02-7]
MPEGTIVVVTTSRGWWWLAGVVAGALGLATSYLSASLLRVRESPAVAVAEGVIELAPGAVASWAIDTFGTRDKTALLTGMFLILALVFAVLGRLALTRWWTSVLGFVALAGVAVVAVLAKPATQPIELVPVAVGLATWLVAMVVLAGWLRRWEVVESADDEDADPTHTRRGVFLAFAGVGGVALVSAAVARIVGNPRADVERDRALLRVDEITKPSLPQGVKVEVEGVAPWQTPVPEFYLIDTAILKPNIRPQDWTLRIHGMVDREIELTYDDLVGRGITEDWITLNCVSNEVGGDLIGNAWWSGVRIAPLLAAAGVQDGADAVLQTSEDGWSCSTPLTALTDDRNAMLAVAMNGEPLTVEHGFPVRTIVPGLYGYVSACKWVVDMEVTRFDDVTAYWTDKGWAEQGPVKLASRVDVPQAGAEVTAGTVVCGGVAWAQHTGVQAVEVSLDGGSWTEATLARVPNDDTWVQWRVELDIAEGEHDLRVRATDKDGMVQTGAVSDVLPRRRHRLAYDRVHGRVVVGPTARGMRRVGPFLVRSCAGSSQFWCGDEPGRAVSGAELCRVAPFLVRSCAGSATSWGRWPARGAGARRRGPRRPGRRRPPARPSPAGRGRRCGGRRAGSARRGR